MANNLVYSWADKLWQMSPPRNYIATRYLQPQIKNTMEKYLVILFTFLATLTIGQNNELVDLRWKISQNESLKFSTEFGKTDTSYVDYHSNSFFTPNTEKEENRLSEGADAVEKYNEYRRKKAKVFTLTNIGNGIIDIVLSHKQPKKSKKVKSTKKKKKDKDLDQMMSSLLVPEVLLRGSVNENGGIKSFWIKNDQKNSIAILFELPIKPVRIGDKWSLDISFINNDQNFVCDSAFRINSVTLENIKIVNDDTIAVLDYDIVEYVEGEFNIPAFFGEGGGIKDVSIGLSYKGKAEFSISNGRWLLYTCIMTAKSAGYMDAYSKTRYSLIPENINGRR